MGHTHTTTTTTPIAMKINVKFMFGEEYEFDVDPYEDIQTLKWRIQEAEGMPPTMQRLIYAGKQLDDYRSLGDYHIAKNSTIHVVAGGCGYEKTPYFCVLTDAVVPWGAEMHAGSPLHDHAVETTGYLRKYVDPYCGEKGPLAFGPFPMRYEHRDGISIQQLMAKLEGETGIHPSDMTLTYLGKTLTRSDVVHLPKYSGSFHPPHHSESGGSEDRIIRFMPATGAAQRAVQALNARRQARRQEEEARRQDEAAMAREYAGAAQQTETEAKVAVLQYEYSQATAVDAQRITVHVSNTEVIVPADATCGEVLACAAVAMGVAPLQELTFAGDMMAVTDTLTMHGIEDGAVLQLKDDTASQATLEQVCEQISAATQLREAARRAEQQRQQEAEAQQRLEAEAEALAQEKLRLQRLAEEQRSMVALNIPDANVSCDKPDKMGPCGCVRMPTWVARWLKSN